MNYTFELDRNFFDSQFDELKKGITPKDTENIAEIIRKRRVENIRSQIDIYGNPFQPLQTPNKTGLRLLDEQYLVNEIFKENIPEGFEVFVGSAYNRDAIAIYQNFGTKNIPATPFFMGENEELGDLTETEIETYLEIRLKQLVG